MSASPLVEMLNIYKSFGGTHAVENVSVSVKAGEVLGVVGHNGAGKSTLIKILAGAYRMDSGEIHIRGEKASINTPRDARNHGIETLYQDLALADHLDAVANLFLGRELMTRWGTLDSNAMGTRRQRGHRPHQPQLRQPAGAGAAALRRPAPVGGHRARTLFRHQGPHHGRADRSARAPRDRGLQGPRAPAQVGGDRHGLDLPRHPRTCSTCRTGSR